MSRITFSIIFLLLATYAQNAEALSKLTFAKAWAIGKAIPFVLPVGAAHSWGLVRDENDKSIPYPYAVRGKIDINPYKLGQCFTVALAQVPNIDLSLFTTQSQTDVCIEKSGGASLPREKWPTRFEYITGDDRDCDLSSGHEFALRSWMLRQPDNSITLFSLFEKSIKMNHGHIWDAVLTIHQILRPHARWNEGTRYGFLGQPVTREQAWTLMNKLTDIRGDLWEINPKRLHGDHQGSWYRIWGTMLFELGRLENALGNEFSPARQTFEEILNTVVFYGEERVIKYTEADLGKYRVDMAGARSMVALRRNLTNFVYAQSIKNERLRMPSLTECRQQIYLERWGETWDDIPFAPIVRD